MSNSASDKIYRESVMALMEPVFGVEAFLLQECIKQLQTRQASTTPVRPDMPISEFMSKRNGEFSTYFEKCETDDMSNMLELLNLGNSSGALAQNKTISQKYSLFAERKIGYSGKAGIKKTYRKVNVPVRFELLHATRLNQAVMKLLEDNDVSQIDVIWKVVFFDTWDFQWCDLKNCPEEALARQKFFLKCNMKLVAGYTDSMEILEWLGYYFEKYTSREVSRLLGKIVSIFKATLSRLIDKAKLNVTAKIQHNVYHASLDEMLNIKERVLLRQQLHRDVKTNRTFALAMGLHERLGAASFFSELGADLLRVIDEYTAD
jgi:hypothetical protein